MSNEIELTPIKDAFANWINIKTICGYKEFISNTKQWKKNENLEKTTSRFIQLKKLLEENPAVKNELGDIFDNLASIEPTLEKLLDPASSIEEETYSELLFVGTHTKSLNFIPLFLILWSFFKIYFIPCLSFIIPILLFITPYIFGKYIFKIHMNFNRYFNILTKILSKDIESFKSLHLDIDRDAFSGGFNILLPLLPILQAMILPYWTFKHLKTIDNIIYDHGSIVTKLRNIYDRVETILTSNGFKIHKNPISSLDNRQSVANILTNKFQYLFALKTLGRIEVIYRLCSKQSMCPVEWLHTSSPSLSFNSSFDHQIPGDKCVPFSIDLSTQKHSILTGPNMGGKSSILRAIACNILLAHTYGCVVGNSCTMTPLSSMFLCLRPEDIPGKKSRFEREVDFTSNCLRNLETKPSVQSSKNPKYNKGFSIVLIDELFHSTNPPDAFYSSKVFCNKLWKNNNTLSVISTHLFELLEQESAKDIKKICCMAEEKNGEIVFSYSLAPGICKVSSVFKILEDYGLCN